MWISELSASQLAEYVFYLTQQSVFFAGTLRENLIYGLDRPPEDEELAHALRQACIFGELTEKTKRGTASLPESDTASAVSAVLDLPVAEEGSNFSRRPEAAGRSGQSLSAQAGLVHPGRVARQIWTKRRRRLSWIIWSGMRLRLSAGIIDISHDPAVMARCEEILDAQRLFRRGAETEIPAAGTEAETPDDAAGAERQGACDACQEMLRTGEAGQRKSFLQSACPVPARQSVLSRTESHAGRCKGGIS